MAGKPEDVAYFRYMVWCTMHKKTPVAKEDFIALIQFVDHFAKERGFSVR